MAEMDNNELSPTPLLPLAVGVDLIRFEKNLLQIGFFGAHDTRHGNQHTRRIEQWANRGGQKSRVAAEFRSSGALGLPSTSDRDKYLAFMKIAMDQRAKVGRLENPIRFTGYQMLKELGLTFSGENYEDINRWGQRMADTTITSEQVIYMAARKKYANKTVHVFRSFHRAGSLDHSGRSEHYEVVLEDWLLENLNQSYVVPEDFNAYRRLRRPTAKGIFGYLHLWFHASHGRRVEKDYAELCLLLNIPAYKHISKISETIGRSLDELKEVGYLSAWDIRPRVTKEGFKLVLDAGRLLLNVLAISRRKSLAMAFPEAPLDDDQQQAFEDLVSQGVMEAKALALVRGEDVHLIREQIAYAKHMAREDRRGKITNPAGFLIYAIENKLPVPAGFKPPEPAEAPALTGTRESYGEYVQRQIDAEVERQFPGEALEERLNWIISNQVRQDRQFAGLPPDYQSALAEQMLRQEIGESGPVLTFDEWLESTQQSSLF